jgi:hypothetical protein
MDRKGCTNCYGEGDYMHLYKGYYWCDGCDYEKLYQEFIEKGLIKEIEPKTNLCVL